MLIVITIFIAIVGFVVATRAILVVTMMSIITTLTIIAYWFIIGAWARTFGALGLAWFGRRRGDAIGRQLSPADYVIT